MRTVATLMAAVLMAAAAAAQGPNEGADTEVRLARLAAERAALEERFAREEIACRARFAVNDCVNERKAERRQALAELRRQELAINAAERQRRGQQRRQALEQRVAPADREDKPTPAPRPIQKSAPVAKPRATRQPPPQQQQQQQQQQDAAANAQAYQEKLQEAARHKARALERARNRQHPPAAPLPVPP